MSDRRQLRIGREIGGRQSRFSFVEDGTAPLPGAGRCCRGYTLVEVLLVLALLAVISAMAWPSLQKPFATRRLYSAADTVRAQWSHARVDAMRSGHTYAFRFEVHGDHFRVAPDGPAAAASPVTPSAEASDGHSSDSVEDGGVMPEDAAAPLDDKTLPEGIKFSATEPTGVASGLPADLTMPPQGGMPDCWSDPIFFYPDGTTSDARLMLTNDYSSAIELVLRGLTGTVTVGAPVSSVE